MILLIILNILLVGLVIVGYLYGRNETAEAYWRGRQEGIDVVHVRAIERAEDLGFDTEKIKRDLFQ